VRLCVLVCACACVCLCVLVCACALGCFFYDARVQVLHSFAVDVLKARLGNVLEAKQLLDLLSRVASVCEVFGTKGRKYIDQERLIGLIMEEKRQRMESTGDVLVPVSAGRAASTVDSVAVVSPTAATPASRRAVSADRRGGQTERDDSPSKRVVVVPPHTSEGVWPLLNTLKLVQKVYQVMYCFCVQLCT
jgi:hypothetical protein